MTSNNDEDDPARERQEPSEQASLSFYAEECRSAQKLYETRKNPMYAWRVILNWAFLKLELDRDVDLPEWCIEYLLTSACRLSMLAKGRDFTQSLPTKPEEPEPYIAPEKRHGMVSQALQLSMRGSTWSAFNDINSQNAKEFDLEHFRWLKNEGLSAAEAMDRVMVDNGIRDERSMKRRFAEAQGKPSRAKLRG